MGLLDIFRTSEKAVDTAADLIKAGADGLDMLFFTDEEKSEASNKFYENWIKTLGMLVDTESIRSITRRYLAVSVVGTWLLLILLGVAVRVFGGDKEAAEFVFEVAKSMNYSVLAVVTFYFGPEMIGRLLGKVKK